MANERSFDEITRESILNALTRIDKEGVPSGLDSRYYEIEYEGKPYPPKVVIAYAHQWLTGTEMKTNSFSGGQESKAFEVLQKHGFKIVKKGQTLLKRLLNQFVENSLLIETNRNQASLKVQDYNSNSYQSLAIKVSFGQGGFTNIPWMGFLGYEQTIQQGIYPVVLYSRTKDKNNFEVCYGVSETNPPKVAVAS